MLGHILSPLSEYVNSNLGLNEVANQENASRRFMYLTKKLNHFWNRCRIECITGLREVRRMKQRKPNIIDQGDGHCTHSRRQCKEKFVGNWSCRKSD